MTPSIDRPTLLHESEMLAKELARDLAERLFENLPAGLEYQVLRHPCFVCGAQPNQGCWESPGKLNLAFHGDRIIDAEPTWRPKQ